MKKFFFSLLLLVLIPITVFANTAKRPSIQEIYQFQDQCITSVCGIEIPQSIYNVLLLGEVTNPYQSWGPEITLDNTKYANGFFDSITITPNMYSYFGDSCFKKFYPLSDRKKATRDYKAFFNELKKECVDYFELPDVLDGNWLMAHFHDDRGSGIHIELHIDEVGASFEMSSLHTYAYYFYEDTHFKEIFYVPQNENDFENSNIAYIEESYKVKEFVVYDIMLHGQDYRLPYCRAMYNVNTHELELVTAESEDLNDIESVKMTWNGLKESFDNLFSNDKVYSIQTYDYFDINTFNTLDELYEKLKTNPCRIFYMPNINLTPEEYYKNSEMRLKAARLSLEIIDDALAIRLVMKPALF